jgi:hypothetical protein
MMTADLDGDGEKEQVVLVNWLTGKTDVATAIDVILAAYGGPEEPGPPLWVRSVLDETGGPCHHGELGAADIEGDGASEFMVTYGTSSGPDHTRRSGELFRWEKGTARLVWTGTMELDTSRDPETPAAEREVYRRTIDLARTLGSRGRTLYFTKEVRVAAGVELPEPRVLTESVVLPPRKDGSP